VVLYLPAMGDAIQKAMIMKKVAAVLFAEMPNAGARLAFQSKGREVSLKETQPPPIDLFSSS